MSTLEDRLAGNSNSVPWIPDAAKAQKYRADGKDCNSDQTLIGTVVDHFTRDNFQGDGLIDVVVLALDGAGEVAIHCGPTVLANQMRSAAPAYGEKIGVKYLGLIQRPGKADYIDYKVVTDRIPGGQIRWAGDGGDVESYVAPQAPPAAAEVRHESAPAGYEHSDDDVPF
jgi:hypothetical protein